jgi:23S rRNA (adenine2503-C2)-methyltransferase
MEIIERIPVPTGDILIVEGEHGKLECLSLGDYGKDVNVHSDALGLSRDIEKVEHTKLLPLEHKWVVTISTQYGCSMKCKICDVPKVGPGVNATCDDLVNQVRVAMSIHPEVVYSKRLNVHYARMGEATWNPEVLDATVVLHSHLPKEFLFHPVVSTMMPKTNKNLYEFLSQWIFLKNQVLNGEAGLQLSINSTDEEERVHLFGGSALSLDKVGKLMSRFDSRPLIGRKYTLNFAVAGWEISPEILLRYFNPERYIIKLTPMHKTITALENDIKTSGDYTTFHPYKEVEEELTAAGYDVLVFIASKEEDMGRITCGNAILSGTRPEL